MPDDILEPEFGLLTFDAEGREGGFFHSRVFHVPTSTSGLTIGRGYDMKMRSKSEVRDDLQAAGLDAIQAALISQAAGRAGPAAEEFIAENHLENFELEPAVQRDLFDIEYARQLADTRRLATKPDVTAAYGATDWDALHPAIVEVLVDLSFRGDYTPRCRRFLQRHVAANDFDAFAAEIIDRNRWPNVPADRFGRRRDFCNAALG